MASARATHSHYPTNVLVVVAWGWVGRNEFCVFPERITSAAPPLRRCPTRIVVGVGGTAQNMGGTYGIGPCNPPHYPTNVWVVVAWGWVGRNEFCVFPERITSAAPPLRRCPHP
ncbi:MAG: hypothetical protein OT477_02925 [Chloroflexi bacterium]|nr:hypothetical protein [Chloroflexota bacterium]